VLPEPVRRWWSQLRPFAVAGAAYASRAAGRAAGAANDDGRSGRGASMVTARSEERAPAGARDNGQVHPGEGTTASHADPPGPAGSRPDLARLQADAVARLAPRLEGPLLLPGDAGYDAEHRGYNLVLQDRPALVVGASGPADVMAAVGFATDEDLPVSVLATGHGASVPATGALVVSTRRMQGVQVDPYARVARVEAGVRWQRVIHECAPFNLAPLTGSAPAVGAVGYTLGGGLSMLGRTFGYAADRVRGLDVVTAHGVLRRVDAHQYADLFWALRGGKGNFGVVTSMEIELVAVSRLYGGGLYFPGRAAGDVLHAYRRWVRTVPEEMNSSVALTRFPLDPAVPAELRGRFVAHVRVGYVGATAEGERLVRPLRRVAVPVLDTLAELPYRAIGSIHNDPVRPVPLYERSAHLRDLDEDVVDALVYQAGPDSTCPLQLVELRHLGGALSRPADPPNAVGHRDAGFLLYLAGVATAEAAPVVDGYARSIMERTAAWQTGGTAPNFLGAQDAAPDRVRAAYDAADYRRLVAVKRAYDPGNMFRVNHNIPPAVPTRPDR
jgi:FAD/FMN-containing dehydrogenase